MRKIIRLPLAAFSLLALLAVAAGPVLPADETPLDLLPPNSKAVLGFRIQALAAAFDANGFGSEMRQQSAGLAGQIALPGFDPLRDIDELIVGSESDASNAPSLIVLSGRFAALAAASSVKKYKNVPILDAPLGGQVLAVLDSSTAIGGQPAMVQDAIDRRETGAKLSPGLAARIAPLRGRL
jgi:hypothetical protein